MDRYEKAVVGVLTGLISITFLAGCNLFIMANHLTRSLKTMDHQNFVQSGEWRAR